MHESSCRAGKSRALLRRTRVAWMLGAGLIAVVILSAGIAIADIPDGNTINACRNKITFAIRVVDKDVGQNCTASETAFSWTNWTNRGAWSALVSYRAADVVSYNGSAYIAKLFPPKGVVPTNTTYWSLLVSKGAAGATGPAGPAGPAGKDGAPGADGAIGPQGPDGKAGPPGADGATGAAGPQGPAGNDGAIGPQGPAGNDGAPGADGATGVAGPQGPVGATGPAGPQGPIGLAGPQGPQGVQGPSGPAGPAGPQGPSGVVGVYPFNGPIGTTIVGPSGTYKFVGPTVLVGTTPGQRITGSAVATLGVTSGSAFVQSGLCYQSSGGGTITNFVGVSWVQHDIISAGRLPYSASASTVPGSGLWNVGYCILNTSPTTIDRVDFVNGWVMVTN